MLRKVLQWCRAKIAAHKVVSVDYEWYGLEQVKRITTYADGHKTYCNYVGSSTCWSYADDDFLPTHRVGSYDTQFELLDAWRRQQAIIKREQAEYRKTHFCFQWL